MKLTKNKDTGKFYYQRDKGRANSRYFIDNHPEVQEEWYEVFMRLKDPTGYAFAREMFESWDDYQIFYKNSKTFRDLLDKWKDELNIRLRSEMIQALVEDATENGKTASSSAKYVLEKLVENEEEEKKAKRKKQEEQEKKKQQMDKNKKVKEDIDKVRDIMQARKAK